MTTKKDEVEVTSSDFMAPSVEILPSVSEPIPTPRLPNVVAGETPGDATVEDAGDDRFAEDEAIENGPAFENVVAESLAAAAEAPPAGPDADGRKAVEAWAVELKTQPWQFAAAKMFASWPTGREVTRQEFEAAVEAACNVTCR